MRKDLLEHVVQILTQRQPFLPFMIEMMTGDRLLVTHPEAIVREGDFFVYRTTDSGTRIFTGSGVCQVIDRPPSPTS